MSITTLKNVTCPITVDIVDLPPYKVYQFNTINLPGFECEYDLDIRRVIQDHIKLPEVELVEPCRLRLFLDIHNMLISTYKLNLVAMYQAEYVKDIMMGELEYNVMNTITLNQAKMLLHDINHYCVSRRLLSFNDIYLNIMGIKPV